MMQIDYEMDMVHTVQLLADLLDEFSAIVDYRVLRDSLPGRLAHLLRCRCVLLYQRIDETLQLAAGSFDDKPGWSAALLAIAHINPLRVDHEVAEARAWRERRIIAMPESQPTLLAVPLIYRQRCIGVLSVYRNEQHTHSQFPAYWEEHDGALVQVAARIVALLLENTRLLARDQERIQELAFLNNFGRQLYSALYEQERVHTLLVERIREMTKADQCAFILPTQTVEWLPPAAHMLLLERCKNLQSLQPLLIERPGNTHDPLLTACLNELSPTIKTLFVVPLASGHEVSGREMLSRATVLEDAKQEKRLLGLVVGIYRRPWKMRREERTLLYVLANQASVVLENIHLIAHVVEARNEARKLLRQVIDEHYFQELILRSIPSGLITTDLQGIVTTCNATAASVLGYEAQEAIGQPLQHFIALSLEERIRKVSPSAQSSSSRDQSALEVAAEVHASQRLKMCNRMGKEIILDIAVRALCSERDELIGMLITFTDVTILYHLEEEKRRLDRLASLGEMAANVAHEVRNPLASIKISMQMLLEDLKGSMPDAQDEDSGPQESASIVLKEVERLDAIVRDLLLFAKPRQLRRIKCDLTELSEHVLQIMQKMFEDAHVCVQRLYGTLPPLWADVAQIEQILFNLYTNAMHAMPDGGTLTISCRVCEPSKAVWQTNEPWVELAVCDTGVGMTQELQERIFQPFFTTKAHGIGLGLSITRRLIEDHGGIIQVESQEGQGSVIRVQLPTGSEQREPLGARN